VQCSPDGNAADPGSGKALPIVVRALASWATASSWTRCCRWSRDPEREIRIEAIQALSRVADEARAEQVRLELQAQMASPDQTISRMAAAAVNELDNRIAGITPLTSGATPTAGAGGRAAAAAHTSRGSPHAADLRPGARQTTKQAEAAAARLDIQTLKSATSSKAVNKYTRIASAAAHSARCC